MIKNCLNCDKQFDDVETKFCSWRCDEEYKKKLRADLDNALKNDKSHTDSLAKGD